METLLYSVNAPSSSATASACPMRPLLCTLLDDVKALRNEVEALHQMLKDVKPEVVKKPSKINRHQHVNRLVFVLQVENPEKVWTSESLAAKIGCTGAAVRQTKAWKDYQKRLQC